MSTDFRLCACESRLDALEAGASAHAVSVSDFAFDLSSRLKAIEADLRQLPAGSSASGSRALPFSTGIDVAASTAREQLTSAGSQLLEDVRSCVRRLVESASRDMSQTVESCRFAAAAAAAEAMAKAEKERGALEARLTRLESMDESQGPRCAHTCEQVLRPRLVALESWPNGHVGEVATKAAIAETAAAPATHSFAFAEEGFGESSPYSGIRASSVRDAAVSMDKLGLDAGDFSCSRSARPSVACTAGAPAPAQLEHVELKHILQEARAAAAQAREAERQAARRVSECVGLVDSARMPTNAAGLAALRDLVEAVETVSARVASLEAIASSSATVDTTGFAIASCGEASEKDRVAALEREILTLRETLELLWSTVQQISRSLCAPSSQSQPRAAQPETALVPPLPSFCTDASTVLASTSALPSRVPSGRAL